jgi:hypothetical protein
LEVGRDTHRLAGTLWLPASDPRAVILMHPGSGPSDRDNDTYFPGIRSMLLGDGYAVASFDKRGVGGSTGIWQHAGIVDQADDLMACLAAAAAELANLPRGAFGHSQGGWVVYEAAGRPDGPDFVIANSGPGVSVAAQERYSLEGDVEPADRAQALAEYDGLCERIAVGDRRGAAAHLQQSLIRDRFEPFVGDDDAWSLARLLFTYDPTHALQAIAVPVLAIYGGDDRVVPVADSVAALRRHVPDHLLEVCVLSGGDHRVQRPGTDQLVDDYAAALLPFIEARIDGVPSVRQRT